MSNFLVQEHFSLKFYTIFDGRHVCLQSNSKRVAKSTIHHFTSRLICRHRRESNKLSSLHFLLHKSCLLHLWTKTGRTKSIGNWHRVGYWRTDITISSKNSSGKHLSFSKNRCSIQVTNRKNLWERYAKSVKTQLMWHEFELGTFLVRFLLVFAVAPVIFCGKQIAWPIVATESDWAQQWTGIHIWSNFNFLSPAV